MRVAFVGKGGSGKTTLSSLFVRHVGSLGRPVLAIDADINQHLALILGITEPPEPIGSQLGFVKEHLRGDNPRISSVEAMVKTTPPGSGSRVLRLLGNDPIHDRFVRHGLMVTGPFSEDDLGVACYHSKVGAVELYLNHLVDEPGEYVVVDMTAGADSFASGLFTRFDLTILVCEPTLQGVGVYQQYTSYAREHEVPIAVVGNKVQDGDDVAFLREHVGDDLLTWFGYSREVRALEQGRPFEGLSPEGVACLDMVLEAVDSRQKDWQRFGDQAVEFHLRNARAWANRATGEDLAGQIDPDYRFGGEVAFGVSIVASASE